MQRGPRGQDPLDPATHSPAHPTRIGEPDCGAHSEPVVKGHPETHYTCNAQRGHTGDHVTFWGDGTERRRWARVCGARKPHVTGVTCTREPGHAGGHKNEARDDYWPDDEAANGGAK